ncbi:polysaccharide biosynthesis protein [Prochlorococcus marinus XMU1412]|uniref:polysaccharide biosynthesis protein n=1 Tax=Prochlorococcus marinus TaxID=1219 RepID=UPI001ADB428D|nr:nucleoside-diphosphate sugar epimerase/dehydratase [Prochlorococcus marinus]MBO8240494.1 polysaccharide biosynthesis protein [Prochlorococcus marinus XMU1412]MBW3071728.1 polysaccharide biosynthesis protein [Prochlorococcus marinus str. MU1412]
MIKFPSLFRILWNANPITRKWILVIIDLLIVILSITLVLFFSKFKNYIYPGSIFSSSKDFFWIYFLGLILSPIINLITFQYKALSRYSDVSAFYQILARNGFLFFLIYLAGIYYFDEFNNQPSFILLWLISSTLQIFLRLTIRDFVNYSLNLPNKKIKNVIIYGAGENGAQLAKNLMRLNSYKIICFIDDDKKLWGRSILGILIKSPNEIDFLKGKVNQILLAVPKMKRERRREIIDYLQKYKIPLLSIPSVTQLISGELTIDNLQPISIDDLLGREVVKADKKLLETGIKNKIVLITGAGGSIGSELCIQIHNLNPKKLIMFEMNENNLYSINKKLSNLQSKFEIKAILGNACNFDLIQKIFEENEVDVVFHAAAYKHVPLVEINPVEGLKNNIISTFNICFAAENTSVENVVFISSDKAVRPTNIMGASKRLSELIIQAFSEKCSKNEKYDLKSTIFSMVRFGNVLDSSGSVVPLFRNQIKNGGPITLTHPKIIRYFMTISEASQLVLQSLSLAKGGDLFLLDMGEPVPIKKLAEQMIILNGKSLKNKENPEGDIEIKLIGLRPGEKLFEELLIDSESSTTEHPLIFRAHEKSINHQKLFLSIKNFIKVLNDNDTFEALKVLKELVPEWDKFSEKY